MSKKDIPDGFEEFAHSINELSPNEREKLKTSQDKFQSFELYSFLEDEVKRLDSMSKLLEDTTYMLKKHSQEKNILELKKAENEKELNSFADTLSNPKNNFWRSLNEIFNDSF